MNPVALDTLSKINKLLAGTTLSAAKLRVISDWHGEQQGTLPVP